MFYSRKSKIKGITLVELMVSVVIFSLMSVALGIILNIGLKSWRDIDGKVNAESGLNNAVKDINESIRNSKYTNIYNNDIATYIYSGDMSNYGYIVLPSYAKYTDNYIKEQELDFTLSSNTDNTTNNITFSSSYSPNFMVAYFLVKPDTCSKCKELFDVEEDLGVSCPHKMLVKKWFYNTSSSIAGLSETSKWSSTNSVKSITLNNFMANRSAYDKILSQNIMTFEASLDTVSHMISYRIKAFKPNMSKTRPSADNIKDSVKSFYNTSVDDPLKKYCIEIRATVAPLNQ